MKQKIKLIFLFLLAFAIVGYIREFFFVHLNIIMYSKYYQNAPARPIPTSMMFFTKFSYDALYYSKYIYTLVFTLLFFVLNYFSMIKLTAGKYLSKILVYSYLISCKVIMRSNYACQTDVFYCLIHSIYFSKKSL